MSMEYAYTTPEVPEPFQRHSVPPTIPTKGTHAKNAVGDWNERI